MTCCVASLCDHGDTILLLADTMIGIGHIEAELEIHKVERIHTDWWLAFAGNSINPVFDIIDALKRDLENMPGPQTVSTIADTIYRTYTKRREAEAEAKFLTPRGWTTQEFNKHGKRVVPDTLYENISNDLVSFEFDIDLLVAGFDENRRGRIFSLECSSQGQTLRGRPMRHDIPGFYAIGSGGYAANYMLYYRSAGPETQLREAVYYAIEAKWFGERAVGVGWNTDYYVLRPDEEPTVLSIETVDDVLINKLVDQLSPQKFRKKQMDILDNQIPELADTSRFKPLDRKRLEEDYEEW